MKSEQLTNLGLRIKKIRIEMKLSQEALADKCGFDRTYISLLERGKRNPSYINLLKLSQGIDMKLSELLEDVQ